VLPVTTWEYASVITANDAESMRAGVSVKLPGGSLERQSGDTSSVLNRLGGEGWELVSYHSSGAGTWGFEQFWLKRPTSASGQNGAVDATLPPGWPDAVRPPGAPDWEQSAVAWLFDLVPPDYRAHEVLRRYPVLLARFARDHVRAGLEAARAGWRTVRVELADELPAEAMTAAITAYEREGARLAVAARGVEVVGGALRGERWVPRL
jgi:hypothetical protein